MDHLQRMPIFNKLPDDVIGKIVCYMLSYGTPSAQVVREYVARSMRLLPPQSNDDNKTLWRYQMFLSQYNFVDNVPCFKNGYYQQSVYYEMLQASLASDDCRVKLQLSLRNDVLKYAKLMSFKLNAIRISLIGYNVGNYGTPSAVIIKQHVKDMKRKRVCDEN